VPSSAIFLNIVVRRHSGLSVLVFPVSVQGEQAPSEIEAALAQLNAASSNDSALVDVIVLAEAAVRLRILPLQLRAASPAPSPLAPARVSAIGHETTSPSPTSPPTSARTTPSAAAELITEVSTRSPNTSPFIPSN